MNTGYMSIDSLAAYALSSDDPWFYAAKSRLRQEFPNAALIEIAENTVTIVDGNSGTSISLTINVRWKEETTDVNRHLHS